MFLKTNPLVTLLLLLAITVSVNAQTKNSSVSKLFNRAVEYSQKEDFAQAIPLFKKVMEIEPENINVIYNLGHCYVNSGRQDSAVSYFNKGMGILEKDDYNTDMGIDLHLSLGKSNQLLYKFEDAIAIYKNMLGFIDEEQVELKKIV